MRSFPSHFDSSEPFGSRWRQPGWVEEELRNTSRTSPGPESTQAPNMERNSRSGSASPGSTNSNHHGFPQHHGFGRQDSIPVHGMHETSRSGSRASTPSSGGADMGNGDEPPTPEPAPGVEKFAGITSKVHGKPINVGVTRRKPKVHHIPIHVEPRDGPPQSGATPPGTAPDTPVESQQNEATAPKFPAKYDDTADVNAYFTLPQPKKQHPLPNQSSLPNLNKSSSVRFIPVQADKINLNSPKPKCKPKTANKKPVTVEVPPPPAPAPPAPPSAAQCDNGAGSPRPKLSSMDIINLVLLEVAKYKPRVEAFSGTRKDKEYLYLDEMITRELIKLDNIETDGNPELRQVRKQAIGQVNGYIHALESNVISDDPVPNDTEWSPSPMEEGNDDHANSQSSEQCIIQNDRKVDNETNVEHEIAAAHPNMDVDVISPDEVPLPIGDVAGPSEQIQVAEKMGNEQEIVQENVGESAGTVQMDIETGDLSSAKSQNQAPEELSASSLNEHAMDTAVLVEQPLVGSASEPCEEHRNDVIPETQDDVSIEPTFKTSVNVQLENKQAAGEKSNSVDVATT